MGRGNEEADYTPKKGETSDILRRNINTSSEQLPEEAASTPGEEIAINKAKETGKEIRDVADEIFQNPDKNIWHVAYQSQAGAGQEEYAEALGINFRVRRDLVLTKIANALDEKTDDLILQEKLEEVIKEYRDSLFYLVKNHKAHSGYWHLQAEPANVARFLRALERKTIIHYLDVSRDPKGASILQEKD